jgi:CRISPR/Cas system-associated protein endoribonuclease Cas2
MTDTLNKKVRKAIVKFSADEFELRYSYPSKKWYARFYKNRISQETIVEAIRKAAPDTETVTLREMTEIRERLAKAPIASGDGATAEEAVESAAISKA